MLSPAQRARKLRFLPSCRSSPLLPRARHRLVFPVGRDRSFELLHLAGREPAVPEQVDSSGCVAPAKTRSMRSRADA
jgi:hypothetical protein